MALRSCVALLGMPNIGKSTFFSRFTGAHAQIGIWPGLTVALLFGFIAKEIVLGGLAVIYTQADPIRLGQALAQDIDWRQAYNFMLFTFLNTPCLSTVAVIRSESKRIGFTALSVVWSLVLAWIASFVFYQGALLLSAQDQP